MIDYRLNPMLAVDEVIELLVASTLAERRPVDDRARMEAMLVASNLIVIARDERGLLLGIARSLSDYAYATYCSDLAVRQSHQRQGIGRELLRCTRAAAPLATVVLLAAPAAVDYYPRIGMRRHDSAWYLRPDDAF
jgi:GNAT superfamily N-acetyltransferase